MSFAKRRAAVAEVATLIRVFPNSIVESNCRGRCNMLSMSLDRFDLPPRIRRRSIRSRQKRAVSVAEKQPERRSRRISNPERMTTPDVGSSNKISRLRFHSKGPYQSIPTKRHSLKPIQNTTEKAFRSRRNVLSLAIAPSPETLELLEM